MSINLVCSNCDNPFVRIKNRVFENNYCSRQCMKEARRGLSGGEKTSCGECGKEIWLPPSRLKRATDRDKVVYCSWDCKKKHYSGSDHYGWIGRYKNGPGYWVLRGELVPEEYKSMLNRADRVLEHRLVVAQSLGRPLEIGEVVHHKNGIKDDNRLENLELHGTPYSHNGVTSGDNRKLAALKRENDLLRQQNELLMRKESLRAEIEKMQERLRSLEG